MTSIQGHICYGPEYAGSQLYPVSITLFWKSGYYQNCARELLYQTPQGTQIYYRHTPKYGWREYDPDAKNKYYSEGGKITFISN